MVLIRVFYIVFCQSCIIESILSQYRGLQSDSVGVHYFIELNT